VPIQHVRPASHRVWWLALAPLDEPLAAARSEADTAVPKVDGSTVTVTAGRPVQIRSLNLLFFTPFCRASRAIRTRAAVASAGTSLAAARCSTSAGCGAYDRVSTRCSFERDQRGEWASAARRPE